MRKVLTFFLFIGTNIVIDAQIPFQEHIVVSDGNSVDTPTTVYSADINGDGYTDILSLSIRDNKIAWYKNINGSGSFSEQRLIYRFEGVYPESISAADVDGDGDLDIIVGYSEIWGGGVWLFKNTDGQGDFSPIIEIYNGGRTSQVLSNDIDGDGDIDIINVVDDDMLDRFKIIWHENTDGLGTFGISHEVYNSSSSNNRINSISIADVDNDGYIDIVASTNIGAVAIIWYKNDGSGNYNNNYNSVFSNSNGVKTVYTSDIDNDGNIDVLSLNNNGNINWYKNNGSGNFGSEQLITNDITDEFYYADIDGDSDIDILTTNYSDNKITWYKNDGLGNFTIQQITNFNNPSSIFTFDLDNDGDNDIISSSYIANEISFDKIVYFINTDGLGSFGSEQVITQPRLEYEANNALSFDIDSDGYKDIISSAAYKVSWYKNTNGDGNFSSQNVIDIPPNRVSDIYVSDLDSNGSNDIVLSDGNDGSGRLIWFNNDGLGNFSNEIIIATSQSEPSLGNGEEIGTADIDNDGDQDVFVASSSANNERNNFSWFENIDGNGNFSSQNIIDNLWSCQSIASADLDGDGDMDIIGTASYSVNWYENIDGAGNFGSAHTIDNPHWSKVKIGDIDSDGDMDIIIINSYDTVGWYENIDGQGNFSAIHIIATINYYCQDVFVSDIDNDGDKDIIVSSSYFGYSSVVYFENLDGLGNFGNEIVVTTSNLGGSSLFATDINGDTKKDILMATPNEDKISWYENLSNTTNIATNITNEMKLYPNPTGDFINIKSDNNELFNIKIMNSLGQIIYFTKNSNRINISSLSEGIYYINVYHDKNVLGKFKIIKN